MNKHQHYKDLKRWAKKMRPPRKVNQHILGVPKGMDIKRFKTVDYLLGRSTPKCPYKFEELEHLQYISPSNGYHLFISCGKFNHVIICSYE